MNKNTPKIKDATQHLTLLADRTKRYGFIWDPPLPKVEETLVKYIIYRIECNSSDNQVNKMSKIGQLWKKQKSLSIKYQNVF